MKDLTYLSKVMVNVKVFSGKTDKPTKEIGQTGQKLYAPNLSMWGYKN